MQTVMVLFTLPIVSLASCVGFSRNHTVLYCTLLGVLANATFSLKAKPGGIRFGDGELTSTYGLATES